MINGLKKANRKRRVYWILASYVSMKTVVTGGAGFIGSHLVERLLDSSHDVIVIDNLSTGNRDNIAPFLKNKKFHFIHADITNRKDLQKIFVGNDWVFHLAALADIVPSIVHPLEYHKANVTGTVRVLEAARYARIKRFIYAASSSCYGIPGIYPTPETARIHPQYPYALTKWVGESYVLGWQKIYKLPCLSLRFFNVYGPRSRTSGTYGAVFGVFLAQKLAGIPFTVVGDGTQTRDFTFVSDAVNALILAAESTRVGDSLNVGTGKPQSVNKLVQLLGGNMVQIPRRPGEPDRTHADIRKIKKALGWKPKVSFEEGVSIILQNINYWRKAPVWTPEKIKDATKDWFTYLNPSAGRHR